MQVSPGSQSEEQADVTVCIVPRERFSMALESLRDILHNTDYPSKFLYVDAGSPPVIAEALQHLCEEHAVSYIRREEFLSPNQARNVALRATDTPFVAFADNDLFVRRGWLKSLMQCARDTGAWAVVPVILEGSDRLDVVHMAGGDFQLQTEPGPPRFSQRHRYMLETLRSVRRQLVREPVGMFEFHCVLLRVDVFPRRDFLDEGFLSLQEHLDHSREIRLCGGEVYFEPDAVVRYDNASPFQAEDREYFELRWSDDWNERSIARTREKWGLPEDDPGLRRLAGWGRRHRELFDQSHDAWLRRVLPVLARRKLRNSLRSTGLLRDKTAVDD